MYRNRAVDVPQRANTHRQDTSDTDDPVNLMWRDAGECRSHPVELFFPDDMRGREHAAVEQRAKTICHGCPVLQSCRQHAIHYPENYGIWGGLSPTDRTRLRRRIIRRPA